MFSVTSILILRKDKEIITERKTFSQLQITGKQICRNTFLLKLCRSSSVTCLLFCKFPSTSAKTMYDCLLGQRFDLVKGISDDRFESWCCIKIASALGFKTCVENSLHMLPLDTCVYRLHQSINISERFWGHSYLALGVFQEPIQTLVR